MLDEIDLVVIGGSGGNGAVSFRRERYVPRGGPDGGDGGRGGSVVLQGDASMLVLDALKRRKRVRAEDGDGGSPAKRHGGHGRNEVLDVPLGTLVWTTNPDPQLLADLSVAGERVVVAEGGAGGRGNARFATATRRTPRFAERGLPGETARLRLELRLLAEVGLVGQPNAGKSSLLRAMSQARPKVGAYPFTTLEPNVGVVESGYETLAVADIPGLIEGAHEGAGLGIGFLQHIRRTRVLVHVIDVAAEDPESDIAAVRGELEAFGHGLAGKPWLAALNKIDLPGARGRALSLQRALRSRGIDSFSISACAGEGIGALVDAMYEQVRAGRGSVEEQARAKPGPMRVTRRERPAIRKVANGYEVQGRQPREALLKLGLESDEARAELVRRLRRMGVIGALARAGAKEGDKVKIGGAVLEWPL